MTVREIIESFWWECDLQRWGVWRPELCSYPESAIDDEVPF